MNRCVVRRAIQEVGTEKIIGYELFFQSGKESLYEQSESIAADAIAEFFAHNSHKRFSDKQMFITFTPSLLFRNTAKIFEKDKVIIQIEDSLMTHPLAMPMIKKHYKEGYKFAINDFQFSPKYFGFLDYADYIRFSIKDGASLEELRSVENVIRMTHSFGKKCIATDLNSQESYDMAVELGADYLEGSYIAETFTAKADKIDYLQGNFFRLVVAVAKDEPNMEEIEEIISRDAGLTYALLTLVNSAYFALRKRTASIRQALMTLGIGQMRQWVYMLSFRREQTDDGSEEMLKLSFLRANFAQALVGQVPNCPISKSEGYMMGMFSTLSYMVDASMEELLEEIPLSDEIRDALLGGGGVLGKMQKLIICYENADWKQCTALARELDIEISALSQIYIDCVEEVNTIWENLTTDFDRPDELKSLKGEGDSVEHIEDVLR